MNFNNKRIKLILSIFFLGIIVVMNIKSYAINAPKNTANQKKVVRKFSKSDLTVDRKTRYDIMPLFVDYEKEWKISTKYGWRVTSPNVGIIKVTEINHKKGTIKIKALKSDIIFISENPGLTYIDIIENYTGETKRYWIKVKPYVTGINITGKKEASLGEKQKLTAITYPENYVGMVEYGKIRWETSNPRVATVDQSGNVKFIAPGEVTITVTYTDGIHGVKESSVDYKVGNTDDTDLRINRNINNKNIKNTYEEVFKDLTRKWTITSKNGWSATAPKGKIELSINGNNLSYKAINTGETYIDIVEKKTNFTKRIKIIVIPPVTSIEIISNNQSYKVGSTYQLLSKTKPNNYASGTGYGSISWSSNNSSVVMVDKATGKIKVNREGTATIKATYSDGVHKVSPAAITISVGSTSTTTTPVGTKLGYYPNSNIIDTSKYRETGKKTYSMSLDQKRLLARVAAEENGISIDGIRLELCLIANLTEKLGYKHPVDCVQRSGWFGYRYFIGDNTSAYDRYLKEVEDIFVKGIRYLPYEVNEHDCFSDISYISTGNVYNRSDYIPYKTIIHNVYGAIYRFVGFAGDANGNYEDPFGMLLN